MPGPGPNRTPIIQKTSVQNANDAQIERQRNVTQQNQQSTFIGSVPAADQSITDIEDGRFAPRPSEATVIDPKLRVGPNPNEGFNSIDTKDINSNIPAIPHAEEFASINKPEQAKKHVTVNGKHSETTLTPEKNALHQYATYTYNITLGAQKIETHQKTMDSDGEISAIPVMDAVLMSSGGAKKVSGVSRHSAFTEDFYIENLNMTSVMGDTSINKGTNTVGLNFAIIEPYSVSLIERLLFLAKDLNYRNYIEIPYIFKIEFVGYDDTGEPLGIIPGTTKWIPFRMVAMNFQVGMKGTIYECTGVPQSHFGWSETVSTIPEQVLVEAGTVGEFFYGPGHMDSATWEWKDGSATLATHNVGLGNLWNQFHKGIVKEAGKSSGFRGDPPTRSKADNVKFLIHPDIAKATLTTENLAKTGLLAQKVEDTSRQSAHPDHKVTKTTYGFNAGTQVAHIIDKIISSSDWWLKQVQDRDFIIEHNKLVAEAKLFKDPRGAIPTKEVPVLVKPKITSTYVMKEYDEEANRHSYEVTYIVSPYTKPATRSCLGGRSPTTNIAKEYDYLFTGKNQDIESLDIRFNLAYFYYAKTGVKNAGDGTKAAAVAKTKTSGNNCSSNNKDLINMAPVETVASKDGSGTVVNESVKKLRGEELKQSIMSDSAGDMLKFDMTIWGDPSFIKQDDILYRSAGPKIDISNPFVNGSIKQDNGDLIVSIKFRVLDDIDHETGMRQEDRQIPDSKFTRSSSFNGHYKILKLDSHFENGSFKQDISVVRVAVQPTDQNSNETESNESSLVDKLVTATVELEETFGIGQNILGGDFDAITNISDPAVDAESIAAISNIPTEIATPGTNIFGERGR